MPPRPPLTHFLCIPLATPVGRPQLARSLEAFSAAVADTPVLTSLSTASPCPLPPAAVRPVGTLHLTLGVLSLTSPELVARAVAVLCSLGAWRTSTTSPPLSLSLHGLYAMQSNAAEASVLYAKPEEDGLPHATPGPVTPLRDLCERVRAAFAAAGLLVPDGRPLLLHATMINTIYAKGASRGRGQGQEGARAARHGRGRWTFDAQNLLDRFGDHVWMQRVPVHSVALCRMGAEDVVVNSSVVDKVYPVEAEVRVA